MQDLDVLHRDLERVRRDLRPARLVALPVRRRSREHRRLSRRSHANRAQLPGAEAADLDVTGDADAEEPFFRVLRFDPATLIPPQARVVDTFEGVFERAQVFAAVVGDSGGRLVGKLIGSNEIPAPYFGRIEPELARENIHCPLDEIGGLRPARAAVGLAPDLVGEDAGGPCAGVRNVVDPGHHDPGERRDQRRDPAVIRAGIHHEREIRSQNPPGGVGSELQRSPLVAPVARREVVFAPCRRPANGPLQHPRESESDHVLAIRVPLRSESTTDFGSDHAHRCSVEPEDRGELVAEPVGSLGAGPDGARTVANASGGDGAGLHRVRDEPLDSRVELHHLRRPRKGRVDVSPVQTPDEAAVRPGAFVDPRGSFGEGRVGSRDDFERLVLDDDGAGGVSRKVRVFGDDDGHRVAHVTDAVGGEGIALGDESLLEAAVVPFLDDGKRFLPLRPKSS